MISTTLTRTVIKNSTTQRDVTRCKATHDNYRPSPPRAAPGPVR